MKIKAAMRIAALVAVLAVAWMLIPTRTQAQPNRTIRVEPANRQLQIERVPTLRPVVGPKIVFEKNINPEWIRDAAKMKLYRLQPSKLGSAQFNSLAQQLFGTNMNREDTSPDGMLVRTDAANPSNFMMLDPASGLLSISRGMADLIDDNPGQLPGEETAVKIARDFLNQYGLGPGNNNEMQLAHIGHIRSQSFDPRTGKEGPTRDQMLTVYFSRLIDGKEVVGGGSKMIVQVGDGGKVAGAGIRWRELGNATLVGEKGIRSAERIQSDIQAFLRREQKLASEVRIMQTGLFYYDDGGNYMQPVIGYEAMVSTGELRLRYFGQTALLTNPPERVGPEPLSESARKMLQMGTQDVKPPDAREGD